MAVPRLVGTASALVSGVGRAYNFHRVGVTRVGDELVGADVRLDVARLAVVDALAQRQEGKVVVDVEVLVVLRVYVGADDGVRAVRRLPVMVAGGEALALAVAADAVAGCHDDVADLALDDAGGAVVRLGIIARVQHADGRDAVELGGAGSGRGSKREDREGMHCVVFGEW